MDPECGEDRRIVGLEANIEKIRAGRPAESNLDPFTPYVPFSPHDDLTVAEVRDFLGFLDSETIKTVVDFIQAEALAHALADDFRSEFVRRQFDDDRKIRLARLYSDRVVYAYDAGRKALEILGPYERCPRLLWWLPFGCSLWRLGATLRKRAKDSKHRQSAGS